MSWSILREGGVPPSTLAVEVEVLEQLPSARRPRRLQVDVRYAQLLAGLPPQPETRKLRCPAEVIQCCDGAPYSSEAARTPAYLQGIRVEGSHPGFHRKTHRV